MSRQKKLINKTNYPQHAIEKFARCVYPDIVAFYQSEEGQREFAEWQAEQAAKKAQRKLHTTKKEVTAAVTSVVILWAFSSVGLLAWKWEECGSRWGSRLARIARNKQIIRTRPRLGRTGSDYIGLVRAVGLEPTRLSTTEPKSVQSTDSSMPAGSLLMGTAGWRCPVHSVVYHIHPALVNPLPPLQQQCSAFENL